jgi:hypothetical protein
MVPERFLGSSGVRHYVNNAVMKAAFYCLAEEKKKFYSGGLFRIKIEIVYIYIASKHCLVGVERRGLRALSERSLKRNGRMDRKMRREEKQR